MDEDKALLSQMTDVEIAWLAGLYEGEGTIKIARQASGSAELTIGMTDEDIIRKCQALTGLGSVYGPHKRGSDRRKPYWLWQVRRRVELDALVRAIRPHLGVRRGERADMILTRLSQGDRRKLRLVAKCGTLAGYDRHRKDGEQTCQACRGAMAESARRRREGRPQGQCRNGHQLDESNVYITPSTGYRSCRQCRRNWQLRAWADNPNE